MPDPLSEPATRGVVHVGLAVQDLAAVRAFLIDALGYRLLGDNPDYPASFVTDGITMLTLWQVADPATATPFDRRRNIGLHHLALRVPGEGLLALFDRVRDWPGLTVEFAPCRNRLDADGSHFMIAMPGGGIRVELFCSPALAGH